MLRALILLIVATSGGAGFAAEQATVPPVTLLPGDYTAQEALLSVGKQCGLGLAAAGLPGDKRRLELPPSLLPAALQVLERTFSVDVVSWRGFLVAEPAPAGGVQKAIRSAAAPEAFPELWRPADINGGITPDYDVVRDAVRVLAGHRSDQPARAKLTRAAYWLAAPTLRQIIRWAAAVDEGRALVAMEAHAPSEEDPCPRHLVVTAPRRGVGDPEPAVRRSFHGPGLDWHEQALRRQKGLIPLEEFVRRLHERALGREHALLAGDALAAPMTLEIAGQPISELARALDPAGVSVVAPSEREAMRVTMWAPAQPKRDVLAVAARVCGLALSQAGAGPRYTLAVARVPREGIPTSVPLDVWVGLASTSVERDRQQMALVKELAPLLEPKPDAPTGPRRADALAGEPRDLLGRLAALRAGGELAALLPALPDAQGVAPLQLYESDRGRYELAGVSASESVTGLEYLRLKTEIEGRPTVTVPVAAELSAPGAETPVRKGGAK